MAETPLPRPDPRRSRLVLPLLPQPPHHLPALQPQVFDRVVHRSPALPVDGLGIGTQLQQDREEDGVAERGQVKRRPPCPTTGVQVRSGLYQHPRHGRVGVGGHGPVERGRGGLEHAVQVARGVHVGAGCDQRGDHRGVAVTHDGLVQGGSDSRVIRRGDESAPRGGGEGHRHSKGRHALAVGPYLVTGAGRIHLGTDVQECGQDLRVAVPCRRFMKRGPAPRQLRVHVGSPAHQFGDHRRIRVFGGRTVERHPSTGRHRIHVGSRIEQRGGNGRAPVPRGFVQWGDIPLVVVAGARPGCPGVHIGPGPDQGGDDGGIALVAGGVVQGRVVAPVACVHIRSGLQQHCDHGGVAGPSGRHMQRCGAGCVRFQPARWVSHMIVVRFRVQFRASLDAAGHDVRRGMMEEHRIRPSVAARGVGDGARVVRQRGIGAEFQQERRHGGVLLAHGSVKRGLAVVGGCVGVGTGCDQEPDHGGVPRASRRPVQGRGTGVVSRSDVGSGVHERRGGDGVVEESRRGDVQGRATSPAAGVHLGATGQEGGHCVGVPRGLVQRGIIPVIPRVDVRPRSDQRRDGGGGEGPGPCEVAHQQVQRGLAPGGGGDPHLRSGPQTPLQSDNRSHGEEMMAGPVAHRYRGRGRCRHSLFRGCSQIQELADEQAVVMPCGASQRGFPAVVARLHVRPGANERGDERRVMVGGQRLGGMVPPMKPWQCVVGKVREGGMAVLRGRNRAVQGGVPVVGACVGVGPGLQERVCGGEVLPGCRAVQRRGAQGIRRVDVRPTGQQGLKLCDVVIVGGRQVKRSLTARGTGVPVRSGFEQRGDHRRRARERIPGRDVQRSAPVGGSRVGVRAPFQQLCDRFLGGRLHRGVKGRLVRIVERVHVPASFQQYCGHEVGGSATESPVQRGVAALVPCVHTRSGIEERTGSNTLGVITRRTMQRSRTEFVPRIHVGASLQQQRREAGSAPAPLGHPMQRGHPVSIGHVRVGSQLQQQGRGTLVRLRVPPPDHLVQGRLAGGVGRVDVPAGGHAFAQPLDVDVFPEQSGVPVLAFARLGGPAAVVARRWV